MFDGWPRGEFAVANTVSHVHRDADDGPDKESDPGHPRKEIHEAEAGQHAQDGNDRHEGHAEWSGMVRLGIAQHHDADTDQDKCEEGTDVRHVRRLAYRNQRCHDSHGHAGQVGRMVRRSKGRMDA